MRLALFTTIVTFSLVLTACSGDKDADAPKQTESATTSSETMAPAVDTSEFASGVIDHSRDEQELVLRQSLYGVEALIEHYRSEGYDIAELEAQKSQLEAELAAF